MHSIVQNYTQLYKTIQNLNKRYKTLHKRYTTTQSFIRIVQNLTTLYKQCTQLYITLQNCTNFTTHYKASHKLHKTWQVQIVALNYTKPYTTLHKFTTNSTNIYTTLQTEQSSTQLYESFPNYTQTKFEIVDNSTKKNLQHDT